VPRSAVCAAFLRIFLSVSRREAAWGRAAA
jgi:hypothetical protein